MRSFRLTSATCLGAMALASAGFVGHAAMAPGEDRVAQVYILSGQSNMQGKGKLAELPAADQMPLTNVFIWQGDQFEAYAPGAPRSNGKGSFGPELGFAEGLSRLEPHRPIYLVKYAASGMPLHPGWDAYEWKGVKTLSRRVNFYPGTNAADPAAGTLYLKLRNTARAALTELKRDGFSAEVKGFIWMQGEADSKKETSAKEYPQMLRLLKSRLAEDLKVDELLLCYGQVLPYTPAVDRFTHREEIRAAMAAADCRSGKPHSIPNALMVPTDTISVGADHVHYDTKGQLELGRAFARAVLKQSPQTNATAHDDRR